MTSTPGGWRGKTVSADQVMSTRKNGAISMAWQPLSQTLRVSLVTSLLLFGQSASVMASPQAQETSIAVAESDAERAVRFTRLLEEDPLAAEAEEQRNWLVEWLENTPDYKVVVCQLFGHALMDQEEPPPRIVDLFAQQLFGNVALQIKGEPGADELSRQIAGIESTLRAYQVYKAADASFRVDSLEDLRVAQEQGRLRSVLAPLVKVSCGADFQTIADSPESVVIPFLGGFLKETHVVYPLALEDWTAIGEERYDEQVDGVSVRYVRSDEKDGWLDVFFYPVGMLDDKQVQSLVQSEWQVLIKAWQNEIREPGGVPQPTVWYVTMPALAEESGERAIKGHILDFSYERGGQPVQSVMIHLVHHLYAVKFRYSGPEAGRSKAAVREDVEHFARRLLHQLDISSTGVCSSPEVGKSAGLVPGCMAEDAPLPIVGDGMRELRIEYRTRPGAEPP